MSIDIAVAELATRQAGAFARWQLEGLGADDAIIRRRRRARRWLDAGQAGVYLLAGAPPSADQALWIAWLAAGPDCVVGFETAAERHGLSPIPVGRLTLIDRHGRHHRLTGVVVHQLDDVLDHHIEVLAGLPTTTVDRTIVDLAAVCSAARLERILEGAVNGGRTTEARVASTLGEIARRGKPGIGKLGRALDDRSPGEPIGESELERMLLRAVFRAGNPPPVPQFPHPGRHPGRGRVDFAYPEAKVILEADGRRWHQRIADLRRDRARDNEAARAGWVTLRFMHEELRSDPEDVGQAVLDVLARRMPEVEVMPVGNRQA
jgi:hypothetical protein